MVRIPIPGTPVLVQAGDIELSGDLSVPRRAFGVVVFAHGSGSSRTSIRNRRVARLLDDAGLATLLVDLLTEDEELRDADTARLRFDIELLSARLAAIVSWTRHQPALSRLPLGLFGASTGAAVALAAAAFDPDTVSAVVSRGGRPDLADELLEQVQAPTLFIVGGLDRQVLELNEQAARRLHCEHRVEVVPGATHLFEEGDSLDRVADLAAGWFVEHLGPRPGAHERVSHTTGRHAPVRSGAPRARRPDQFEDRDEAGEVLARAVAVHADQLVEPLVVALPRGGVPVAMPVARMLGVPVEAIVTRKVGVPGQPEVALGAVDEEGFAVIDDRFRHSLRLSPDEVHRLVEIAHEEAVQRAALVRGDRPVSALAGHDVVLVDDGYATGMTSIAAARYLHRHGARRVVLAIPVAPRSLMVAAPLDFDLVICPITPDRFRAVGLHYRRFDQVPDDVVHELLRASRNTSRQGART
jgi:predicted phosphoribosyltransferase/dienelactone hydrolase